MSHIRNVLRAARPERRRLRLKPGPPPCPDAGRMDQLIYDRLTPKELECLRLVARNRSSKEIARLLGRSANTVDNQIKSALSKSGAPGRYALAAMVAEHEGRSQGLASQPPAMADPPSDPLPPPLPKPEHGSRLREEALPFHGFAPPIERPSHPVRRSAARVLLMIGAGAAIILVLLLGTVALLQGAQTLIDLVQPTR